MMYLNATSIILAITGVILIFGANRIAGFILRASNRMNNSPDDSNRF